MKHNITQSQISGTRIAHLNVYHLYKKLPDVCLLLNEPPNIHLLGLSETRIDSHITDDMLAIPNYNIIRRDAVHFGQTGLAVYIHDDLSQFVIRRSDLESSQVECIWFEVKYSMSPPLLLGYVYRNPASTQLWLDDFVHMMDKVNASNNSILLLGDFNFDMFKPQRTWVSTTSLFGLHQLVQCATRVTPISSTLLDHIYTNNKPLIADVKVLNKSISDHSPVTCKWLFKPPKRNNKGHTTTYYRSFKNFDQVAFLHNLSEVQFHHVLNSSDPTHALDAFYDALLPVIDKHAPLRKKRVKSINLPGWLTPEIKEAMSIRDRLQLETKQLNKENISILPEPEKIMKQREKEEKIYNFKKQRNKVTALIRASKITYFNRMITANKDTASLWQAINKITKKSQSKPRNNYAWSPNSFNNHFLNLAESTINAKSACPREHYSIPPYLQTFCNNRLTREDSFELPLLAVHEVGALITGLKNKKSLGPDNISPSLLKVALPYIVEPLTFIYNMCIDQSVVPSALKSAKVIPLPKSRDLSDLNNFRPISLLPIISKPLEKHVHKHLMKYIENHHLFHQFQSGFRHQHSCQTALIRLCDTWLSAINQNKIVGAVFLDLKKAFDLVDHNILLQKLSLYLQNRKSLSFFKSYLDSRTQNVFSNGSFSSTGLIKCGVPQGSVLGPLLFCIFINDLPLSVLDQNVSCDLFADDTSLHSSSTDVLSAQHSLQSGLNDVSIWCSLNQMILHPQKTKSMVITTRQKRQISSQILSLTVDKMCIEQVHEHRVLGVTIDEEFKWQSHIDSIVKKLSRSLFLLNQLKPFIDSDARKMFFHAHCISHINYASAVWSSAANNHHKKLNTLYKRAAKIILPDPSLSTSEKQAKLNIMPLQKQLEFNKMLLMFKIHHDLAPQYLKELLTRASSRYGSINYILPRTRIDMFKTSLTFSGTSLWNSLPSGLKTCSSISCFKSRLRKHFHDS
jgi:hypothetical protein